MFVPISFIVQEGFKLDTQEDIILMLDKFLLPAYPNHTTSNPAMTKTQCFSLISAFMQAGKLHIRFKPEEVDKAVNAFMEDRLWVEKDVIAAIRLAPGQSVYDWMAKPSLLRMGWLMLKQFGFLFRALWQLLTVGVKHKWYSFYAERTFTVPKAPSAPKGAEIRSLAKKDS